MVFSASSSDAQKAPVVVSASPVCLVVMPDSREAGELRGFLSEAGYDVAWARDGEIAYNVLDGRHVDAVVTHLNLHRIDGLRLLEVARMRNPEACVVLIADEGNLELATEAMRGGAYDFQVRPLNLIKLKAVLDRGLSHQRLRMRLEQAERRMDERYGFEQIIGRSAAMHAVYRTIRQIAPAPCNVLICGETGTGKELVAQAIHQNSPRRDGPFVSLNCGALAEGIVESELFGHERGAFTGAVQARSGRFEVARGGTLFLDEVGEVTPATQVKLLRVLETGQFERLGGGVQRRSDARVLAATNRDLPDSVRSGTFRRDLYFRLNVVRIDLPPLRDRKEDLPILAGHFLETFNRRYGKEVRGVTRGAMQALAAYDWPGNVRELKNVIEGAVVFATSDDPLDARALPKPLRGGPPPEGAALPVRVGMSLDDSERILIGATLRQCGYDKPQAAKILGIGLRTLYRKIKVYSLE